MGAIFGSILSSILGALAGPLTDKIADVAKAYINKEISQAEFDAQVKTAILACFSSVEATWAEASTKQFEAFQETLRGTPMIQRIASSRNAGSCGRCSRQSTMPVEVPPRM